MLGRKFRNQVSRPNLVERLRLRHRVPRCPANRVQAPLAAPPGLTLHLSEARGQSQLHPPTALPEHMEITAGYQQKWKVGIETCGVNISLETWRDSFLVYLLWLSAVDFDSGVFPPPKLNLANSGGWGIFFFPHGLKTTTLTPYYTYKYWAHA